MRVERTLFSSPGKSSTTLPRHQKGRDFVGSFTRTNLPKHRVNFVRPYNHKGIDYTGHVWVDTDKGAKKYYILILTCLNIRSIHLELVESMSSAAFVQAFIRFTNTYGIPIHIYSDNTYSFK